jgi:hypothetical protein
MSKLDKAKTEILAELPADAQTALDNLSTQAAE